MLSRCVVIYIYIYIYRLDALQLRRYRHIYIYIYIYIYSLEALHLGLYSYRYIYILLLRAIAMLRTQQNHFGCKILNLLAPQTTTKENPNMLDPSSVPTSIMLIKSMPYSRKRHPHTGISVNWYPEARIPVAAIYTYIYIYVYIQGARLPRLIQKEKVDR